jgi:hypothetical protein
MGGQAGVVRPWLEYYSAMNRDGLRHAQGLLFEGHKCDSTGVAVGGFSAAEFCSLFYA